MVPIALLALGVPQTFNLLKNKKTKQKQYLERTMKCNKMSSACAFTWLPQNPFLKIDWMKPLKISKMYFDLRLNLIDFFFLIFLRDFFQRSPDIKIPFYVKFQCEMFGVDKNSAAFHLSFKICFRVLSRFFFQRLLSSATYCSAFNSDSTLK